MDAVTKKSVADALLRAANVLEGESAVVGSEWSEEVVDSKALTLREAVKFLKRPQRGMSFFVTLTKGSQTKQQKLSQREITEWLTEMLYDYSDPDEKVAVVQQVRKTGPRLPGMNNPLMGEALEEEMNSAHRARTAATLRSAAHALTADLGEVAEVRVKEKLVGEREVAGGDVDLTILESVGPESWDWHDLRGKMPPYGAFPGGRLMIGDPSHPDAGLLWTKEHGKPIIHQVWVAPDMQRKGVGKVLLDLYRKHVHPKAIFAGPFSRSGEAFARKYADKIINAELREDEHKDTPFTEEVKAVLKRFGEQHDYPGKEWDGVERLCYEIAKVTGKLAVEVPGEGAPWYDYESTERKADGKDWRYVLPKQRFIYDSKLAKKVRGSAKPITAKALRNMTDDEVKDTLNWVDERIDHLEDKADKAFRSRSPQASKADSAVNQALDDRAEIMDEMKRRGLNAASGYIKPDFRSMGEIWQRGLDGLTFFKLKARQPDGKYLIEIVEDDEDDLLPPGHSWVGHDTFVSPQMFAKLKRAGAIRR